MSSYRDKASEGNSKKHLSGKDCIDCGEPAGTAWSPYWCVDCNIKRMDRIDGQLSDLQKTLLGKEEAK